MTMDCKYSSLDEQEDTVLGEVGHISLLREAILDWWPPEVSDRRFSLSSSNPHEPQFVSHKAQRKTEAPCVLEPQTVPSYLQPVARYNPADLEPIPEPLVNEKKNARHAPKSPKHKKFVPVEPALLDAQRGRGRGRDRWPGNQTLRRLVNDRKMEYKAADRKVKRQIATAVLEAFHFTGGRYLDYLCSASGQFQFWYEMDDKSAMELIEKKLREGSRTKAAKAAASLSRSCSDSMSSSSTSLTSQEDNGPVSRSYSIDSPTDAYGHWYDVSSYDSGVMVDGPHGPNPLNL